MDNVKVKFSIISTFKLKRYTKDISLVSTKEINRDKNFNIRKV